jgi:hypothetical protein
MQSHRFTIANLMFAVVFVAILLTVFRAFSLMGVIVLIPFAIAAFIAPLGSSPLVRRRLLWVGVAGTLLLPFLFAILINTTAGIEDLEWQEFLPALSFLGLMILSFVGLIPTLIVQAYVLGRDR